MKQPATDLETGLRRLHSLYGRILKSFEAENLALRQEDASSVSEVFSGRAQILPELAMSGTRLREFRQTWTELSAEERTRCPEIKTLLRQCQDLAMKALTLDRENEQGLLRRGLLSPRHLPSHQTRRPGVVADLYRRQASA